MDSKLKVRSFYCKTNKTTDTRNIFVMLLCVAGENPNGCGETKLQAISLWLCGLLTSPNLCCDLK